MVLKKQEFKDDEIPIFDEACVYKRGEYWQFRMWLAKENKCARKSLRTRSETTAVKQQQWNAAKQLTWKFTQTSSKANKGI